MTKDELIKVGTEIIAQQGFGATGINSVLTTAGVPKGSFYYYFQSKEDYGLAVIDNFAVEYAKKLDGFLKDKKVAPLQRIRNYLESGVASMSDGQCTRGCLIGNLGQELAGQNEAFRKRLNIVFREWERQLEECVKLAQDAGEIADDRDAAQLAGFLLTGWEGAILRAKVTQSITPMTAFLDVLFNKVLR